MKLKNQEVNRVKFSRKRTENDPVRLIRKRIEYLSATDKNKPGVTQQFEKDISAAIREMRNWRRKRHGPTRAGWRLKLMSCQNSSVLP